MRKAKIRVIDQGTVYDVMGNMRGLQRRIDRGEFGRVQDMAVVFSDVNGEVRTFHFGPGGKPVAHWLLSTGKNRVEPA